MHRRGALVAALSIGKGERISGGLTLLPVCCCCYVCLVGV